MIYNSCYWIRAIALEPTNNHEIVVLEKNNNGEFTIRHAKDENDWLYNQAAYINEPTLVDEYGKPILAEIHGGDYCRCLIVNVTMK